MFTKTLLLQLNSIFTIKRLLNVLAFLTQPMQVTIGISKKVAYALTLKSGVNLTFCSIIIPRHTCKNETDVISFCICSFYGRLISQAMATKRK